MSHNQVAFLRAKTWGVGNFKSIGRSAHSRGCRAIIAGVAVASKLNVQYIALNVYKVCYYSFKCDTVIIIMVYRTGNASVAELLAFCIAPLQRLLTPGLQVVNQ
jgi:hypothetical protein